MEAGFYVKEDGRVNPVDVTMALGKGARLRGVQIFEGVSALGVLQKQWTGQRRSHRAGRHSTPSTS